MFVVVDFLHTSTRINNIFFIFREKEWCTTTTTRNWWNLKEIIINKFVLSQLMSEHLKKLSGDYYNKLIKDYRAAYFCLKLVIILY